MHDPWPPETDDGQPPSYVSDFAGSLDRRSLCRIAIEFGPESDDAGTAGQSVSGWAANIGEQHEHSDAAAAADRAPTAAGGSHYGCTVAERTDGGNG